MYVKPIKQNSVDSHQTSPGYCLTFVRWDVRDTQNNPAADASITREPLIVVNDAVTISVSHQKGSKTPMMSATLMGGDINYSTAVHTGDFVFVNILDWDEDIRKVEQKARELKPINGIHDGFKGFYKIQAVTRNLITSEDGHKTYYYTINAAAFTEFDTTILYNPAIQNAFQQDAVGLFMSLVGSYYSDKLKSTISVEVLLQDLFEILIGKSRRSQNVKFQNYGNTHYAIPAAVGSLLGKPNAAYVSEIYNLITGIWDTSSKIPNPTKSQGFNPNITPTSTSPNIYKTGQTLEGGRLIAPENWNYKTAWSILQDNLNNTLNEMYVDFRVAPDSELVQPVVIARQKPFNNLNFTPPSGYQVTKFLTLPRWKIRPEMVMSAQFYKNEALRFNFVQTYTRSLAELQEENMANQIALKNFKLDDQDIQRHGLRPYIQSSNFDFPFNGNKRLNAKEWNEIIHDWMVNGNLKESGTMQCVGIEEPIAVGDNIEFDNVVYHIEGYAHNYQVMRDGKKRFQTTINVSYGVDIRSSATETVFPEMERTDRFTRGVDDYASEQILPGFSDTQDIAGRVQGEEIVNTKEASFQRPLGKKPTPTREEDK